LSAHPSQITPDPHNVHEAAGDTAGKFLAEYSHVSKSFEDTDAKSGML
jgi:hypothetical protein